ncbi:amino acid transporter AVT1C-like isoform X2 [Lytechinus variegatus]|uniref:amino acid transporter AVT1C-like isoform X2 n=1 Tax=Lytechinus variegatus TaxID=7654 RepID=UPI001BB115A1|nr:amino acid transporter AVT1C-like isoform X2 [Lytechinus variegatus]
MASTAGEREKVIPLVPAGEGTPFAKGDTRTFSSIPDPGDGYIEKENVSESSQMQEGASPSEHTKLKSGMNVTQTAIFVASQISGLAVLVIPPLLVDSGWPGLFIYPVVASLSLYTAILLGRSWNILCKRKPELCRDCRLPYSALAGEAYGQIGKRVISFTIGLIGLASTCTFLLGVSELMFSIIYPYQTFSFCYWPLIIFLIICPLLWFSGPKELWEVGAVGTFATFLGSYILTIKAFGVLGGVSNRPLNIITHSAASDGGWSGFFGLLGSSFFLTGPHYIMPTIQRDMAEPQHFSKALVRGMGIQMLAMFILVIPIWLAFSGPLAELGYVESVLNAVQAGPVRTVVSVLLLFHFVAVLVMSNNPLFQELEHKFDIPHAFNWKRILLRTSIFLVEFFIVETFPHFAIVTSLTGGIFLAGLSMVAPIFIHLKLRLMETADDPDEVGISMPDKLVCILTVPAYILMIAGIIYYANFNIHNGVTVLTVPCYVNATAAHV